MVVVCVGYSVLIDILQKSIGKIAVVTVVVISEKLSNPNNKKGNLFFIYVL